MSEPISTHPAAPRLGDATHPVAPRLGDATHPVAPRLGDLLVEAGVIPRERVELLVDEARHEHKRLGELLLERQALDEVTLYRALAQQRGLRLFSVDELVKLMDSRVSDAVPRTFLERHGILPLALQNGTLLVATSSPTANADDAAKVLHARSVHLGLVTPTDFRRLWALAELRRGAGSEHSDPHATRNLFDIDPTSTEQRFVALFEALLLEAISERASDIHLERYEDEVRVRIRVDGDLTTFARIRLSPVDLVGLVNVVKVAAQLDIAERRLPQGGRIRRRAGEQVFDLRVQTQPALYGEHLVIRILPQTSRVLEIEELGFDGQLAGDFRRLLDSPGGLLLVVGPTGSGKSTSLYAGLQHIAKDASRKVITVEDPIEYALRGVQQTAARPDIGFDFSQAMRAFVREDPDVILVGEIRDRETALEAIRASQTGHLVLSTLHCNDAVDAVQRLTDLDMHPNSVASELLAVIAQRLAKRICPACRAPAAPDPVIAAELFPQGIPPGFRCFAGRGCAACGGHGTHGRIAVTEYLRSNVAVRRGIARGVPVDDLRLIALRSGLSTMRRRALALVHEGVLPLSELPWVLPAERMAPDNLEDLAEA
jgi:type IV pilus assembly protein PilB